tara:strand:- start:24369 stop:25973 length:1605 start_codon:yes stop_codon:yes gene_type:complete
MKPRPYQQEALNALDEHLRNKKNNPCVVLPTGAGKSPVIAWALTRWKQAHPPLRAIILAHRTELVEQNAAEMEGISGQKVGIYAASIDRRDTDTDITYASIDSVAKRHGEFPPVDVIIVDEAHRIPPKGEGKYRTFIAAMQKHNPNTRVVGFTATPYRMGCGPICHKDHILNEVCYEANIADLIKDGYLCPLRAKTSEHRPDLSKVKVSNGDYQIADLAKAVDTVVVEAVAEVVRIINQDNRKSVVVFCVNAEHCQHVSDCFKTHGIHAPTVTGKTNAEVRRKTVDAFRDGKTRVLCNINVYTEGFNVKQVDCVVLLRPTQAAGLYAQMVGRGLRLHPQKDNCLVLDYGQNIETHGPLDQIDGGAVRLAKCKDCSELFSHAVGACPSCGWTMPKREVERMEAEQTERILHAARAAEVAILSNHEQLLDVDEVTLSRHICKDAADKLRVSYRCGLQLVHEWLDLDGDNASKSKAQAWWAKRFGWPEAQGITVNDALCDMFMGQRIQNKTKTIVVTKEGGKAFRIVRHNLKGQNER